MAADDVTWSLDAERFNPNHAPPGAGGGQFASASGGGGSKGAAASHASAAHKEHLAHEAHLAHMAHMAHLKAHPIGQGERGKRVSDLQDKLNALGAKPPLASDGMFGPKTLAAVKAFQRAHGLKVDGLVGPETTAALEGAHAAPKAAPAHHHAPAHHAAKRAMMHEPLGKPGGPGLWGMKGAQLPAYIQHVRNDLMQSRGMDESKATQEAIGIVRDWAAGRRGASAGTQAKAVAAVAEFESLRAKAKGTANRSTMDDDGPDSGARKAGGMARSELVRDVPLEDYHVVRSGEGDSSGRVIEAYMTVFGEPTVIHDGQGDYEEEIDRAAFNKRIADLERSHAGFAAAKVFYNHAMTLHGTPSDRYSMPVAVCEGVRAEARGPITRARYLDTPLGNEVLEMWRSGAITAQSFTGAIIRSTPELRRGEKYRPRNGRLMRVRRLELGLKEFGPTPFPAYTGAQLVGVRMSPLGTYGAGDEDEEVYDEALPPDGEAVAGGPQDDLHPSRMNAHRLWRNRLDEACREAGIVLPGRG